MKISKELFESSISNLVSDIFDKVNYLVMNTQDKKCTKELIKTHISNFIFLEYKKSKYENYVTQLLLSMFPYKDTHLKKEYTLLTDFYEKYWNWSINSSLIWITLSILLSKHTKISYSKNIDKSLLVKGLSKATLDWFVKKLNSLSWNENYNYFDFIVNKIYSTISSNIKELKKSYIIEGDSSDWVKVKKWYNTIEEATKAYLVSYKKSKNIALFYYIPNSVHKHIANSLDRIILLKFYWKKIELWFDYSDKYYNKYKDMISYLIKSIPSVLDWEYLVWSFYTQIYDEFNILDEKSWNQYSNSKAWFTAELRKYALSKYWKFWEFIIKFWQLNYQVGNWWFRQWIDNWYANWNKTLLSIWRILQSKVSWEALTKAMDILESYLAEWRSQYVLDSLDTKYYAIDDICGVSPIEALWNMFAKIFKTTGSVNDTVKYINENYLK